MTDFAAVELIVSELCPNDNPSSVDALVEKLSADVPNNSVEHIIEELIKRTKLEPNKADLLRKKCIPSKQDKEPVVDLICRLVRDASEGVQKFKEIVSYIKHPLTKDMFKKGAPIMVLHPSDTSMVRVFPNLMLDGFDKGSMSKCSKTNLAAAKSAVEEYQADLKDEHKAKKWATFKRAWTYLKRHEDISTAKALTRLFPDAKDNDIRDFATLIETERKPLQLLFAETPEDFRVMYGSGPTSCMSYQHDGEWLVITEAGLSPPSFYAWYPCTKGAYFMKGGQVAARVMCFRKSPTSDKWEYGRIYASNETFSSKLVTALAENGITAMNNGHSVPEGIEFKVPGIKYGKNDHAMPWPYFDDMSPRFQIKFNQETKEFEFKTAERGKNAPHNGRGGYLLASDYQRATCDHCGCDCNPKEVIQTSDGAYRVCSQYCLQHKGYVIAKTGAGDNRYLLKNEAFKTADGFYYTNQEAAFRCGARLAIEVPYAVPEDGDRWLMQGPTVSVIGIGDLLRTDNHDIAYRLGCVPIRVPVGNIKQQKTVIFDSSEPLFEIAA